MIPEQKLTDLIQGLIQKTEAGQAQWQEHAHLQWGGGNRLMLPTPIDQGGRPLGGYQLILPQSVVTIDFVSPSTEPDHVRFEITNKEKRSVVLKSAEEGDANWELLYGLYSAAHRSVTKWDEVIGDIESFIQGKRPVTAAR